MELWGISASWPHVLLMHALSKWAVCRDEMDWHGFISYPWAFSWGILPSILYGTQKKKKKKKRTVGCPFPLWLVFPLWFEFSLLASPDTPLDKLQNRLTNVQCLLYQSMHCAEESSRRFSEGEYSSHTIITLCPRSNTEVFGAPLLLRSSGCNISNTSPRKCCARANNYKSLQALLHFRFFIYASIKSFPFLCHLQL